MYPATAMPAPVPWTVTSELETSIEEYGKEPADTFPPGPMSSAAPDSKERLRPTAREEEAASPPRVTLAPAPCSERRLPTSHVPPLSIVAEALWRNKSALGSL